MKQYERYKESGVEWLGRVPEHWDILKIKYAFNERVQKGFPNEPLLSSTQNHGVIPQQLYENRTVVATKDLDKLKLVEVDDFVISLRSFQGGLEYAYFRGIISPAYTVLTPVNIEPEYFRFLGKSNIYIQLLKSCVTGIREGQNIDYNILKENYIPVPSIEEQKAIAHFLDQKCTQIDKAISQKEKVIELLNERRQIIIQRAVTRGLDRNVPMKDSGVDWIGEIPEHWEVKKIKYSLLQQNIKIESRKSYLPYVGMENIESGTGLFVSSVSEVEGMANYFKQGNVLFGKLRPYLAKVYLATFDGLCSTEFIVFDTLLNNNRYIQKLLLSRSFIALIDSSTYGSKMPRADVNFIQEQFIPLPSKMEQQQIAAYLDQVNIKIDKAIAIKRQEIEKLKEYKTVLIDAAVTGKIKIA